MKSWKEKKDFLFKLIKEVSDYHGGDDPAWLVEYCNDVLKNNDIDEAIACFQDLQPKKLKREV